MCFKPGMTILMSNNSFNNILVANCIISLIIYINIFGFLLYNIHIYKEILEFSAIDICRI